MEEYKNFINILKTVSLYNDRKKTRKNIIAAIFTFSKIKNLKLNIEDYIEFYDYLIDNEKLKNKDIIKIVYDDLNKKMKG